MGVFDLDANLTNEPATAACGNDVHGISVQGQTLR
jgi:hypothetical protein